MKEFRTYYDDLGVSPDATPETIRGAYRSLAQKWHPDRNRGQVEESENVTRRINVAYGVLSSPVRRREHDGWIKAQRRQSSVRPLSSHAAPPTIHQQYKGPPPSRETGGGLRLGWLALALALVASLLMLSPYRENYLVAVLVIWLGTGGLACHALFNPIASAGSSLSPFQVQEIILRRKAAGVGWLMGFITYPLAVTLFMVLEFAFVPAIALSLVPAIVIGLIGCTVTVVMAQQRSV